MTDRTPSPIVLTGCADAATLDRLRAALSAAGVTFVGDLAELRRRLRTPSDERLGAVERDLDVRGATAFLEHWGEARIAFVVRDAVDVLRVEPGTMERWRARCVEYFAWPDERSLVVRWEKLGRDPAAELARLTDHLALGQADAAALASPPSPRARLSFSDWLATQRTDNRDAIRQAGYPDPRRDPRLALWPSVRAALEGIAGRR